VADILFATVRSVEMEISLDNNRASHYETSGVWPARGSPILNWLMRGTHDEPLIDKIFVELCSRLRAAGVTVARGTLHFRTHHPQWLGTRIIWRSGMRNAEVRTVGYHVQETAEFLDSPLRAIINGANEIRRRLQSSEVESLSHPLYEELGVEGLTDYIAWPLDHTLGKRHLVTFASDAPRGFDDDHVAVLADILPALSLVSEIRLKNQFARTLLETYVGPHASEQILDGATTRGSGATVNAAILICDLRNFTALSNLKSRDEVIDVLNGYFDAMAEPIERHGGEILKFMGDGLLAIFPLSNPTACRDLLRAIGEAQTALAGLNEQNLLAGRDALSYGIGVHVGEVMYGNIGSRKRLDFTVIGPAVNIASRLENLTKEVKRSVLFSKAFVEMAGCESKLEVVGSYPLRGLGEPVTVFAFSAGEVAENQAG
jgi:adenylate cyclase